jgi:hypothetical protein
MVPYDPGGIGVQWAYGGFIPSLIGLTGTMQASAFSEWALFILSLSALQTAALLLCDSFSTQPHPAAVRFIYFLGGSSTMMESRRRQRLGHRTSMVRAPALYTYVLLATTTGLGQNDGTGTLEGIVLG